MLIDICQVMPVGTPDYIAPEVLQCLTTTGKGSHMLFIVTRNSASLEDLLRTIQSWPGVQRTETQLILSDYKMIKKITDLTTI